MEIEKRDVVLILDELIAGAKPRSQFPPSAMVRELLAALRDEIVRNREARIAARNDE